MTAWSRSPTGRPCVVVQVFGALDRGGAETRTLDVAGRVAAEEVHLIYVCLSGRPGALAPRAIESGAEVVPMRLGPLFPIHFIALLRRSRVDVVHSHVALFSGVVVTLARIACVRRRICHFRSDGDEHGSGTTRRIRRALFRVLVDRSATDIIGVSPGALTYGWRSDWARDGRCAVIPNGLDLERLPRTAETRAELRAALGIPIASALVVFVGRSSPAKAVDRALAVLGTLLNRDEKIHVLVVGPFDDADRAAISALHPRHRVHVLGVRDDVPELLHAADVALLTSRREGLPGVVLESVAVGTPVVASDIPGTQWIAQHTSGIVIVPTGTSEEGWAAAVSAVTSTAQPRRREDMRDDFSRGPFRIEESVARISSLWKPTSRPSGHGSPR